MEMNANLTHNVAKMENAKKIMGKLTKIQSTFSILLFGQKRECLDAFRLRGRHRVFPFASGLPQVKGKNNESLKTYFDSPRVTSGKAK